MPSLRQVGHCNELASFWQSAPRHLRFVGGSSAMLSDRNEEAEEEEEN